MRAAVVAVVLMGAALRFWRLGASRLNFDESFTAMASRMPFGALLTYLRRTDSHPPLDYLLRAPLSRFGASDFAIRLPSALCSVTALIAFAIWSRRFGRAGLLATTLMALSVFELQYGREARMYAELQLVGVLALIVLYAYLQSPRQRLSAALGVLTLIALLTHVSGLLLAGGIVIGAGPARGREANRLRAWIVGAVAVWAALWGRSFITQSQGHHSSWIPRTTLERAISVVGSLVVPWTFAAGVVLIAIIAGAVILAERDSVLTRTWCACCGVPIGAAIILGRLAPVLIDRTLTLFAGGAFIAVGFAIDRILARRAAATVLATAVLVALLFGRAVTTVSSPSGPNGQLRALDAIARPGDVVAIRPRSKGAELNWSLGVRSAHGPARAAEVDLRSTPALLYTGAPATDHVWLLDFHTRAQPYKRFARCAPDRVTHGFRVMCLEARVEPPDDVTLLVARPTRRASSSSNPPATTAVASASVRLAATATTTSPRAPLDRLGVANSILDGSPFADDASSDAPASRLAARPAWRVSRGRM